MGRLNLYPYKQPREDSTSSYESERHSVRGADFTSAIFRAEEHEGDFVVGDVIAIFPLFGSSVPFQFDITSSADSGTFYFDVGLAVQGDDEALDDDVGFGGVAFFASIGDGTGGTLLLPPNQVEPLSLVRNNPNRRVQTIRESVTFATNIDAYKATGLNYDVILTVNSLPATYNFILTFNMVAPTRQDLRLQNIA